ncbi:hypothetical protein MED01_005949 [Micromonospora sp. MED01]|uniref:hypothetical protein n=1 Tax=Micromonospora alfalfae TaxID=2911212 RepID=UPI001EE84E76|nr:hypothetical protein [Micromonospora alfalfae]MCG5466904.1 hypothetical protein [Micromonospora alfalfae]
MSPPATAPRPPRPITVTVAFWLQLAVVLVLLGLAALTVAEAVHFDGQIDRAVRLVPDADPDEVAGERQGNVAMTLVLGVPAVLLAVWLAATAVPVRRGVNVARVLVFVASGGQLLVCFAQCCSGGFLVPALTMPDIGDEPSPDWDEWETSTFFDTLYSGTDPWDDLFFPAAGLGVLTVLALSATVVLLLALPPANRWFVPPTENEALPGPAWVMPVPAYAPTGYGYPTAPLVPGFLPPNQPLPPGYLICPDPAAHLTPGAPGTSPGPTGPPVAPPDDLPDHLR